MQVIGLGSKGGRGFILSAYALHKPKELANPIGQFFNVLPIKELYQSPATAAQV